MGAYNILKVNEQCLNCGTSFTMNVQFKFGDTWQYNYVIGEKLRWGGADVGIPNLDKVKVYGISELEHCPHCQHSITSEYDIMISNDVILNINPLVDLADYNLDVDGCYCLL